VLQERSGFRISLVRETEQAKRCWILIGLDGFRNVAIIKLVRYDHLQRNGDRASDIHIETRDTEVQSSIGSTARSMPKSIRSIWLSSDLISRIKVMSELTSPGRVPRTDDSGCATNS